MLTDAENAGRVAVVPAATLGEVVGPPHPVAAVDPSDTAILLYTSGSTGRPKGALLSHRSQLFTLESWATVETSHTMTRTLVAAPLFHKNGLGETKLALWQGAEVVLQRRFDARAYLEAAAAERCSTLSGVPTMFALMMAERDLLGHIDLSDVRGLEIGSAPLTESLLERVREVFPQARVYNSYGTTEVAAIFGEHPRGLPPPRTTVGHPLPTVDVRLVGDGGADENPGELWVRCEGVMDGYLGAPELTGEKIVDGWCRTGDVMLRDEQGWFHFVGRVDDMFACGGENVYPGAVEQLLERHPAVRQAAVVAVADDVKGAAPVAFVVVAPGAELTEEDVQALGARPRARVPAPAIGLVRRRAAARDHREGGSFRAHGRGPRASRPLGQRPVARVRDVSSTKRAENRVAAARRRHGGEFRAVRTDGPDRGLGGLLHREHDPLAIGGPRRRPASRSLRQLDRDGVHVAAVGVHDVELSVGPLEHDPLAVGRPRVVEERCAPRRDPDGTPDRRRPRRTTPPRRRAGCPVACA